MSPAKQGLAQLLSNTLDEGAGDVTAKDYQAALRDHAIDLSFRSSRDNFSGNLRTLVRHKAEAFKLMKLAVTAPRFDAEAVERMRGANLSRIKSYLGEAEWIASRLLYDRIYAGHPYALNSGGTLATMQALSADDLRAEWKRIATRDKLVVGITGDLTKDEAVKIIDETFGALPAKTSVLPLQKSVMPKAGKPVFYAKDMPQTILSMAWDGIGVHDADYYAAVVMDYIFGGGGFSSRLMAEIREKRGFAYSIHSSLIPMQHSAVFVGKLATRNEKAQETISVLKQTLKNFSENGVSETELEGAKRFIVGSFAVNMDSNSSIVNFLTVMQLYNLGIDYMDKRNNLINSVSVKQVGEMAKRLVQLDKLQIVMIGNPKLDGTK